MKKKIIYLILLSSILLLGCGKRQEFSLAEQCIYPLVYVLDRPVVSLVSLDEYHFDGQAYLELKYDSEIAGDIYNVDYLYVSQENGFDVIAEFPLKPGCYDAYMVYYEAFQMAKEQGTHTTILQAELENMVEKLRIIKDKEN